MLTNAKENAVLSSKFSNTPSFAQFSIFSYSQSKLRQIAKQCKNRKQCAFIAIQI